MWTYKDVEIHNHTDLLDGCTDFVYIIHYDSGELYIGKKCLRAVRKKKPTKAMLAKRKNYSRKEMTDLPFVDYKGSHEGAEDLVITQKKILYQCSTKKAATYLEAALLFHHDAIFDPIYLNKNISGVHFDNSLDGLLED